MKYNSNSNKKPQICVDSRLIENWEQLKEMLLFLLYVYWKGYRNFDCKQEANLKLPV